jgi:hypothetical protein
MQTARTAGGSRWCDCGGPRASAMGILRRGEIRGIARGKHGWDAAIARARGEAWGEDGGGHSWDAAAGQGRRETQLGCSHRASAMGSPGEGAGAAARCARDGRVLKGGDGGLINRLVAALRAAPARLSLGAGCEGTAHFRRLAPPSFAAQNPPQGATPSCMRMYRRGMGAWPEISGSGEAGRGAGRRLAGEDFAERRVAGFEA